MVMDESDALETLGNNLENIFYETRERLKGKGKGKSKKGKGKGFAKTFGQAAYPGFGGGRGGCLEHRRMLQASRNARGYDRPSWQSRAGTRMSLHELKAKSRCHQCKQVGHWSKECPQRGKLSSGPGAQCQLVEHPIHLCPQAFSWNHHGPWPVLAANDTFLELRNMWSGRFQG